MMVISVLTCLTLSLIQSDRGRGSEVGGGAGAPGEEGSYTQAAAAGAVPKARPDAPRGAPPARSNSRSTSIHFLPLMQEQAQSCPCLHPLPSFPNSNCLLAWAAFMPSQALCSRLLEAARSRQEQPGAAGSNVAAQPAATAHTPLMPPMCRHWGFMLTSAMPLRHQQCIAGGMKGLQVCHPLACCCGVGLCACGLSLCFCLLNASSSWGGTADTAHVATLQNVGTLHMRQ